jgi:intracellular sulfur oxidation DsrE/DsrF family protein
MKTSFAAAFLASVLSAHLPAAAQVSAQVSLQVPAQPAGPEADAAAPSPPMQDPPAGHGTKQPMPPAALAGAEGAFYIAGDRFTLEQAFADAALDKLNAAGSGAFVIVAIERESAKLTVKGAKPNVKNAVRQLQRAGGTFYLCERDVRQAGFDAKDLLPGVKIERALKKQEGQATGMEAAQAGPELRRIRRVCS